MYYSNVKIFSDCDFFRTQKIECSWGVERGVRLVKRNGLRLENLGVSGSGNPTWLDG